MSLRILLACEDIPQPHLGGLGKHVILLANALIEAGHHVDLFGNDLWPNDTLPGDLKFNGKFSPALSLRHGAHWKEQTLGFFNYYRRAFLARRFARAFCSAANQYDVVHYHGHLPNLANYIPKSLNFVQTRHDQGSDCSVHLRFRNGDICRTMDPRVCAECATARPNQVQRILSAKSVARWRDEVRRAFRRHKVIFVSHFLRDNLARTLGPLADSNVHVVHNFVDIQGIFAALNRSSAISPAPDIFVASRVDSAKGVGNFLRAAQSQLPESRHVTVAGDGPELSVLAQTYREPRTRLLGWKAHTDVLRMTASANVVVIPSLCEEAFGQATLEALVLSRPVFALRRGGTPELARYQRYPDQLNLCENMEDLVDALRQYPCTTDRDNRVTSYSGDVRDALPLIEAIYRK